MKLLLRSSIAALALGLISAPDVRAQDKPVTLKFSHWVPPTHPMHAAAVAWAESIEKASNGSIKITIFPAQQLGKAFDHYNMARDGIAEITHVNPGYEPGRFPIIGAVELPFVFSNAKEGSAALDAWYRRYAERGHEGRALLPRLRARSGHASISPRRRWSRPGRHVRPEVPAAECRDRATG